MTENEVKIMSEVVNPGQISVPKYHFICFHCNADVVYNKNEIHRNPALARVVRNHGYQGFTGEIHCPSCGTWLPHYDQNQVSDEYGKSQQSVEPAAQGQSAPAQAPEVAPQATDNAEQDHIFCIYCGKKLPADAVFCGFCGKKLQ